MTFAFIFGVLFGIALITGRERILKRRRDASRTATVAMWREDLEAKKVVGLCECGQESSPMALPVEPLDNPAEAWREDFGGESS